jgi:hypothetical protein
MATYVKRYSRCGEGLTPLFMVRHVPVELILVLVPLDRIQIPALHVIVAAQGHRVGDVSSGRHFQAQQLQALSSYR